MNYSSCTQMSHSLVTEQTSERLHFFSSRWKQLNASFALSVKCTTMKQQEQENQACNLSALASAPHWLQLLVSIVIYDYFSCATAQTQPVWYFAHVHQAGHVIKPLGDPGTIFFTLKPKVWATLIKLLLDWSSWCQSSIFCSLLLWLLLPPSFASGVLKNIPSLGTVCIRITFGFPSQLL